MINQTSILTTETIVEGLVLAKIVKLETIKGITLPEFKKQAATIAKDLLPHHNFTVFEDYWNASGLKNTLFNWPTLVEGKPQSVAVFEEGRLTCKKEDFKKSSGIGSSEAIEEDKDYMVINFKRSPDLNKE